jgi:hypothetical protein
MLAEHVRCRRELPELTIRPNTVLKFRLPQRFSRSTADHRYNLRMLAAAVKGFYEFGTHYWVIRVQGSKFLDGRFILLFLEQFINGEKLGGQNVITGRLRLDERFHYFVEL